jgi:hypothetical protein
MLLLESWRGRLVRVEEMLARGTSEEWRYNRHFCTWSRFALVVKDVRWRISGSALIVEGSFGGEFCSHEVNLDTVVAVRRPDGESVAFKERFGQAAERVSVFQLVRGAQDAEPGAAPDPAGTQAFPGDAPAGVQREPSVR